MWREDRETETYVRVCDAVDPIATRALLLLPIAGAIVVPLDAILSPVSQNGGETILALMHKCLEPGAAVLLPFSMQLTPTSVPNPHAVVVHDPTNSFQTFFGWAGLQSMELYFSMASVRCIHDFVDKCGFLTHIDLRGLRNLKKIGSMCMSRCPKLASVNLCGLSSLESIGCQFLADFTSLTSSHFSGLSSLQSIGYSFLARTNLRSVDLSSLTAIRTIPDGFMSGCSHLERVDLSLLVNVETIGDQVLSHCSSLRGIHMEGLANVAKIGSSFLYGSNALMSLDMSGMSKLEPFDVDLPRLHCLVLTGVPAPTIESVSDFKKDHCVPHDCEIFS